MSSWNEYVEQQVKKARIAAVKERILSWIEKLETGNATLVDLLETPEMKRESCDSLAPFVPTGNVDVVLKLESVAGIQAKVINPNRALCDADNWTVE